MESKSKNMVQLPCVSTDYIVKLVRDLRYTSELEGN